MILSIGELVPTLLWHELFSNLFLKQGDTKISRFLALDKATVARNLTGIHFLTQGTLKIIFLALAKASVARNLRGALLFLKGTVK